MINTILLILVILLSISTAIFYTIEIAPYINNKIGRKYNMLGKHTDSNIFKKLVLNSAIKYAKNEAPKMSLADNTFFPIVFVRQISLKLKNANRLKNSFPRGYLLNGIFDYAHAINDVKTINSLEKIVDKYIANLNEYNLKYVDQATMGMIIIKLYKYNRKTTYKNASDTIVNWLLNQIDSKHNIILYRPKLNYQYVDTLGMICPFLLLHATTFNHDKLIEISNNQIEFYIKKGLTQNGLPFHAINTNTYAPMGSSNWGRGLGWYILALSATIKYTNRTNNKKYDYFLNNLKNLNHTLNSMKQDIYWGQFLGQSKKWHIDTSVSCMIFYSLSLVNMASNYTNFYNFIKPLTSKKGEVDYTSGDTEDINIYSREYGKSELTQGLLLSIFKNQHNEKNIN